MSRGQSILRRPQPNMMEEDPPSPDASPPLSSVPHRHGVPQDPPNNNAGSQYTHLRTLYHLQNMLSRQLNLQPNIAQPVNNTNNTGNATEVVIDMPPLVNSPHNESSNNPNNPNNPANAGDAITTHEIDGTRLDLQLLTTWVEQSFPFVILLLLVWVYEHRNGMS
jgi:hypothetical protein